MALYDAEQLKQLMAEDVKRLRSVNNYEEGTVLWQRKNLQIVADALFVLDNPDNFSMSNYYTDGEGFVDIDKIKTLTTCGSSACAIGHGILVGIEKKAIDRNWPEYAQRVFGFDDRDYVGNRLFGAGWAYEDDTAKGAAQRIYQYLEKGIIWYDRYDINYLYQQPCDPV